VKNIKNIQTAVINFKGIIKIRPQPQRSLKFPSAIPASQAKKRAASKVYRGLSMSGTLL
jgi:hypothetical protein